MYGLCNIIIHSQFVEVGCKCFLLNPYFWHENNLIMFLSHFQLSISIIYFVFVQHTKHFQHSIFISINLKWSVKGHSIRVAMSSFFFLFFRHIVHTYLAFSLKGREWRYLTHFVFCFYWNSFAPSPTIANIKHLIKKLRNTTITKKVT